MYLVYVTKISFLAFRDGFVHFSQENYRAVFNKSFSVYFQKYITTTIRLLEIKCLTFHNLILTAWTNIFLDLQKSFSEAVSSC